MEREKCIFCKKRYVNKQEWKTQREKELCLTCLVFDNFLNELLIILWKEAKNIGLDFRFSIELKPIKKKRGGKSGTN